MAPRLTEKSADARRSAILGAAVRLFADKGFHRASMADLFEATGLSAGSVYSWFDGKAAIVEAVCRRSGDAAHVAIARALSPRDPREALSGLVRLFGAQFDRPGWTTEARLNVQVVAEALHDERLRNAFAPEHERFRGRIADAVRAWQAEGRADADVDPSALARALWSLYLGLEQQKALDPDLDHRAYAEAATALVAGSLTRNPEDPMDVAKQVVTRCLTRLIPVADADPREFLTEDYDHHSPDPTLPPGIEGFRRFHSGLHAAFPDLAVEVLEVVSEGDTVAARTRWTGTHTGPFMGMPPKGRRLEMELYEFFYVRGDRIAGHRAAVDTGALARQLG